MKRLGLLLRGGSVAVVLIVSLASVGMLLASAPQSGLANLPGSGWWSGHQIQNTGPTTATVAFVAYDQAGTSYSCGTQLLGSFRAYTFFMNTDCSSFPAATQGSAVVSADQPIVAVVNVTNRFVGGQGIAGGEAAAQYVGISGADVSTQVSFPLFKRDHSGRTSTFFLQNAGSASATMTATFVLNGGGGTFTHVYNSVPPNAMTLINPADAGVPSGTGNFGALTVVGSQPMAGSLLEAPTTPVTVALTLQATSGFPPTSFAPKAYAPTIKRKYGPLANDTGLQVQNVSGGGLSIAVNVAYTIYASPSAPRIGTTVNEPVQNIADGASHNYLTALSPLIDGEFATAIINTSTANGKLIGVVSERTTILPLRTTTYQLIPAPKATTKISLPSVKERQNLNKRTGVQVQNVGVNPTSLTLTYKPTDGSGPYTLATTVNIQPGASKNFLDACIVTPANTVWGGSGQIPCNKFAAVLIQSGGEPIVAVANESVVPGSGLSQDSANYEGFNIQ